MLADEMKVLLGTTFQYYWKAHAFHMNVEGSDFYQYHKLFGEIYESAYGTVDTIGEYIRTLDGYAPPSVGRLCELGILNEQTKIPRAALMVAELLRDGEAVVDLINRVLQCAQEEKVENIANYMAELLDIYQKNNWFLRSTTKTGRE